LHNQSLETLLDPGLTEMPLLHTEALTLRRRRTRDADALITLFCRQYGKITASARSVMKTTSRLAGVTQPFHYLNVVLYAKNESQDIWTLTQVALIHRFASLQNDLWKMAFASCLCEWMDLLSEEFESNMRVWDLLLDAFQRWETNMPAQEELFFYQWHLLADAGWQPEIRQCVLSGKKEESGWIYLPQEGGIAARGLTTGGLEISGGAVQALRRIADSNHPPNHRLSIAQKNEINLLLKRHLEFHGGGQSRSSLFLDKLFEGKSNFTD
jgi:DNA repair protein RecO (recombination protein O)